MEFKDLLEEHSYYCSGANYYSNDASHEYDSWKEFDEEWGIEDLDLDYNHVFRFDLKENEEPEVDDTLGKYYLEIFFMLQRKGIFKPVLIKNITEGDFENIVKFLKPHWDYTKNMWEPLTDYNENSFKKKIITEKIKK